MIGSYLQKMSLIRYTRISMKLILVVLLPKPIGVHPSLFVMTTCGHSTLQTDFRATAKRKAELVFGRYGLFSHKTISTPSLYAQKTKATGSYQSEVQINS